MSNPWFRLYNEFATDPKVQMMGETLQRRLIMLFCLKNSGILDFPDLSLLQQETPKQSVKPSRYSQLSELEQILCFCLRISKRQLKYTKEVFIARGFIDENWQIISWSKRQFISDSSKIRVAKHRLEKKATQDNTTRQTDKASFSLAEKNIDQNMPCGVKTL